MTILRELENPISPSFSIETSSIQSQKLVEHPKPKSIASFMKSLASKETDFQHHLQRQETINSLEKQLESQTYRPGVSYKYEKFEARLPFPFSLIDRWSSKSSKQGDSPCFEKQKPTQIWDALRVTPYSREKNAKIVKSHFYVEGFSPPILNSPFSYRNKQWTIHNPDSRLDLGLNTNI